MSDIPVMKMALKLIKISGQHEPNNTRFTKIIIILSFVFPGVMFVLGILEPILNFTSLEALSDSMDIVCNYLLVSILVNIWS